MCTYSEEPLPRPWAAPQPYRTEPGSWWGSFTTVAKWWSPIFYLASHVCELGVISLVNDQIQGSYIAEQLHDCDLLKVIPQSKLLFPQGGRSEGLWLWRQAGRQARVWLGREPGVAGLFEFCIGLQGVWRFGGQDWPWFSPCLVHMLGWYEVNLRGKHVSCSVWWFFCFSELTAYVPR